MAVLIVFSTLYILCGIVICFGQLASKATRKFHKPNTRIQKP